MKSKDVAEYGLMVALAMVLSYLEAQMPVFFAVPGMKLGLTNLVVLIALVRRGEKSAFCINVVRIVLTAFTFGSMSAMLYSLAGAALSLAVMILCRKADLFHVTGVSIAGGVAHNIGQLIVAMLVLENASLLYYLPVLLLAGTVAGALIGFLGAQMLLRLGKVFSGGPM